MDDHIPHRVVSVRAGAYVRSDPGFTSGSISTQLGQAAEAAGASNSGVTEGLSDLVQAHARPLCRPDGLQTRWTVDSS